jgi:hypothetical protein
MRKRKKQKAPWGIARGAFVCRVQRISASRVSWLANALSQVGEGRVRYHFAYVFGVGISHST